jgi:hypothetical protein
MKRKHLTETLACPEERLFVISNTTSLSFALERIGPLATIIITVFYLLVLYLIKTKNNTFQILEIIILNKKNTILNMKIFKIVYKSTYEEYIGTSSEFAIYPSLRHRKIFIEFWLSAILRWLIAYPVVRSTMCFNSMDLCIAK